MAGMPNSTGVLAATLMDSSLLLNQSMTTPWPVTMDDASAIDDFATWYAGRHGYISIVVCIIGAVANFMNIIVLTQKNMISPTNAILTGLAVADMLTMAVYLPYAIYFYCISIPDRQGRHAYGWVALLLFHNHVIITAHTISMWLTVALAVFRYIVVCHHTLGPTMCNLRRAHITIVAVVMATILILIPNYVMYKVVAMDPDNRDMGYWFNYNEFITPFHESFNRWLFGVVLKVAPCILLTVLSALLIRAMRKAEQRRRKLMAQGNRAESERTSEHNRTTSMLVAVVLCFVVAELPQGTLAFLSGVDQGIFDHVYVPLGDLWDILVLINSSINFILYCTMSKQFRNTFHKVFFDWCPRRKTTSSNGTMYTTIARQKGPVSATSPNPDTMSTEL